MRRQVQGCDLWGRRDIGGSSVTDLVQIAQIVTWAVLKGSSLLVTFAGGEGGNTCRFRGVSVSRNFSSVARRGFCLRAIWP